MNKRFAAAVVFLAFAFGSQAAWKLFGQSTEGKPFIPQAAMPEDLPQATIPAFPGAEGGGRFSFGGRGGKVYVVTSLEDEGPGTFREACEAAGPRIVVFNVAGNIKLKRPIHIRSPYISIAGQSAPGDGVCISNRSTLIDTHDVVIRYLRFRRGATDADRDDALGGNAVGNIVIDHCSCSWGFDENISLYRHVYKPPDGGPDLKLPTVNITIQWCISSEALNTNNHAFGGTWGGRNSSFHHNLFACNTGRNPSIGMSWGFNFTNNVMFNWRHRTMDGGDWTSQVNVINNYYKPGPITGGALRYRIAKAEGRKRTKDSPTVEYGRWYVAGNYVDGRGDITTDNWAGGVQFEAPGAGVESTDIMVSGERLKELIEIARVTEQFPLPPVTLQTAEQAYESVLADTGASLPRRDPVDVRIIEAVRTGKVSYPEGRGIITDISQVGGFPEYKGEPIADADRDGMPDWWESKNGLNPSDATDAVKDKNGDGYTNIEKYLNGIDPATVVDFKDPKNNVNTLKREALFGPMAKADVQVDAKEAAYVQVIEKRTQDILALLNVNDSAKLAKVHDAIIAQYRGLQDWQTAHEAKLKELRQQVAKAGAEEAKSIQQQIDEKLSLRKSLRTGFLAKLAAELSPEQIEKVKDKMTYNTVEVTYVAYRQMLPNLTEAEKSRILELLKAGREEALDGGNSEEKHAIINQFKGKINNYLSAQGYDLGKASRELNAKQRESKKGPSTAAVAPGSK